MGDLMAMPYEAVVELANGQTRRFPVDGVKQSIFIDDAGRLYVQPGMGEISFVAQYGSWLLVTVQERTENSPNV